MIVAAARVRGVAQPRSVDVDERAWRVRIDDAQVSSSEIDWDVPAIGDVYGIAFNLQGALEKLGEAVHAAPYLGPPKAPVLYIKPINTRVGSGAQVILPADVQAVRCSGALGIVIGRAASRVKESEALQYIGGYTVVNDVSVPHENFYRPAIREKCRDTFCPIGPWVVSATQVSDPNALVIKTFINDELMHEARMSALVRSIPRLIADVSAFMTLAEGDVLLAATAEDAPLAHAGDRVAIEIGGIGRLENRVVRESEAALGVAR